MGLLKGTYGEDSAMPNNGAQLHFLVGYPRILSGAIHVSRLYYIMLYLTNMPVLSARVKF